MPDRLLILYWKPKNMTRETFEAGIAYEGERLDKYLNLIFSETAAAQSRSFFQKLIKEGHVLVNDTAQKANYRLKEIGRAHV